MFWLRQRSFLANYISYLSLQSTHKKIILSFIKEVTCNMQKGFLELEAKNHTYSFI